MGCPTTRQGRSPLGGGTCHRKAPPTESQTARPLRPPLKSRGDFFNSPLTIKRRCAPAKAMAPAGQRGFCFFLPPCQGGVGGGGFQGKERMSEAGFSTTPREVEGNGFAGAAHHAGRGVTFPRLGCAPGSGGKMVAGRGFGSSAWAAWYVWGLVQLCSCTTSDSNSCALRGAPGEGAPPMIRNGKTTTAAGYRHPDREGLLEMSDAAQSPSPSCAAHRSASP